MRSVGLQRSTPLRRSAALKRGEAPKRRTPISPVNRSRRARLLERNYGERGPRIRAMPCACAPSGTCRGRIHAAHVVARGMGGCNGDRRSLVPLCAGHHDEQGRVGVAGFGQRYGLDLHAIAASIAVDLDAQGVP